jgi:hypothetical protein
MEIMQRIFEGETIFLLRVGVASVVCLQGRQQLTVVRWDRRVRPSNGNVPFYDTSSRVENVAWCLVLLRTRTYAPYLYVCRNQNNSYTSRNTSLVEVCSQRRKSIKETYGGNLFVYDKFLIEEGDTR